MQHTQGTIWYGILFSESSSLKLLGFVDSDLAGSIEDSKSTSSYCFTLGSGIICSSSKKQSSVAQSTAEVEYMAASAAVN